MSVNIHELCYICCLKLLYITCNYNNENSIFVILHINFIEKILIPKEEGNIFNCQFNSMKALNVHATEINITQIIFLSEFGKLHIDSMCFNILSDFSFCANSVTTVDWQ